MNVQDYITSGSIESCVLGLADANEQQELMRLCDLYPEIRAARNAFESALEAKALSGAVPPPDFLRNNILAKLAPATKNTPLINLPLEGHSSKPVVNWKKYLVAAGVILLAGSAILNAYLYRQYRKSDGLYNQLLASRQELADNNQSMQTRLRVMEQDMQLISRPDIREIKMQAVNNTNSLTTVYWDVRSRDVFLMVNQLPAPAAGQQYQLWAIVDGVPVNAGMVAGVNQTGLLKMKNIQKAEAFAITLEKSGGSLSPTLTAMFVMGKV